MAVGQSLRHIVESQQFSRDLLEAICERADAMKREPHRASGRLQGRVLAALFYELASVMSGIDPQTGQHMWRVTPVVDPKADASVPCNPYLQTCDVLGRPKATP